MRRLGSRFRRRGSAAAEFVITFPVIFLLFVSTVEFGNFFSDLSIITSVTQSGAKFGARQDRIVAALTRGATSTVIALSDLGYSCSSSGISCRVTARVVNSGAVNYIEIVTEIPYQWVSQSNEGHSKLFGVIPAPTFHARALYPHVGDIQI